MRKRFVVAFSVGMIILAITVVRAQEYPNKPIRVLASEAGGGQDFHARIVAQGISEALGQRVIVDNRKASILATEIASKAPADGYTLLVAGPPFWIAPLLQALPYDPMKDFSPITLMTRAPNVLVVHPSLTVKSVKDLIAFAKAKPGELNYGTSGTASGNHLSAELFKSMAGINIVRISYTGGGPLVTAMLSGEVQMSFGNANTVRPHIQSGKVRALAVTSARPSEMLPGLPTVASTIPGYESVVMNGMFAPAKTPRAVIARLNREIVRVLSSAEVKERLLANGVETVGSSPEQFSVTMESEMARMGKVIKEAGIKVN